MLYVAIAASILLGATAGWAYTHRPSNQREHTTTFQLWSVSGSVLGPQTTADVDGQRFVAGLRLEQAQLDRSQLRHAIVTSLRTEGAQGAREAHALAQLATQRGTCLVSVPRSVAANVAYAAAGCGLMATAYNNANRNKHASKTGSGKTTSTSTSNDSAYNHESTVWINGIPDTWRIQPLPSWLLGLGSTGHPISINLVPGATVLIHGDQHHVNTALAGLPWDSTVCTVIRATDASPSQVRAQWEQAWDRTRMRIVIADPGSLPEHFTAASVELHPSGTSQSVIRSQGVEMFFDSQVRSQTTTRPSVAPPPPDPPHPVPAVAGRPPASATGSPYPPIAGH